jgi:oxaloacetate decarboxylase beta subunit
MLFDVLETGFLGITWGAIIMIVVGAVLLYLGIAKKMEPLLLVPIGFGVILVNLPFGGLMNTIVDGVTYNYYVVGGEPVGLLARLFHYGLDWEVIPLFIFLGLGAMTDFGPIIANPKTLILGAGAQFGVYFAFFAALLLGFDIFEAASIGIIGGADGPTTIYLTNRLAPTFIGSTAVAAYTYMALVPMIQPPIIKLCTTKKERQIYMKPQLREVSRKEKVIFPVIAAIIIILLVPASAPLIGMFMLGNLLRESGVTDRLAETAANAMMNILTVCLGLCVGAFMTAENFLRVESLLVFVLGIVAFSTATAGGIMLAKFMNLFIKEKINPMIGAAEFRRFLCPAASSRRWTAGESQELPADAGYGPNIACVIGTASAAGLFIGMLQ